MVYTSWLEKICAMTDTEATCIMVNDKGTDKTLGRSLTSDDSMTTNTDMEHGTRRPSVQPFEKSSQYPQRCQNPSDHVKSVALDVGAGVTSPMSIRTDLSLDTGSVDSPYIAIPLNCSVEDYSEPNINNLNDNNAMLTPCQDATSPDVTFTELTPVKVAKPQQTSPLDYSGKRHINSMRRENSVNIQTTGPVSITDIVTSGNVISIATAEPVSITDVIATANGISIATAEPISYTQLDSVSRNNCGYSQQLNTCDMNANLISKRPTGSTFSASRMIGTDDVRNIVREKQSDTNIRREPLEISRETAYYSTAKRQFDQDVTSKTEEKPAKRKRNRRKPDPDEPPLAPPVTVLPPCAVCGSKSSGFHYGANTCEACKGFFRRTLKKNEVKFQCCCSEEEKQERRQDGGVGKNTCPACRYQQCLAVGMSRNAIKIGRYSLQRKTNNICYVKTLEGNDESRNGEHSPASSLSSLNSPPTNVKSPHIDVSSPPCSGTAILNQNSPGTFETASPIGSSKYAPPAKKLKLAGEITLTEVDTYVKTLYHAFKCLLEEASVLQQDKLRRDQQQYLEGYRLKQEMFGISKPITKEQYFELYNSTGIELDNRKEHVMEAVKYFEGKISKLVEFAKCIPGFRDLTLQDQANLIKAARIDCNILSAHKEMFGLNTEDRIATTPWGKHLHLDEIENVVKKDFVLYKHKIKQMVNALDLSAEEEAILAGVILTFTDRCELNDPDKVQTIQYKLLACLQYLIEIRPNSQPNKLGRIFNFLIAVRDISEREAEIIKQVSLDFPGVVSIERMESRVFSNLGSNNYLEDSQQ